MGGQNCTNCPNQVQTWLLASDEERGSTGQELPRMPRVCFQSLSCMTGISIHNSFKKSISDCGKNVKRRVEYESLPLIAEFNG